MGIFSLNIKSIYKLGRFFRRKKMNFIANKIDKFNCVRHNSYLSSKTEIGANTSFAYGGIGLVIHANATIGDYCSIGQGITIGGVGGVSRDHLPVIENHVYLGAGCRVLGNVRVGHDSIIAPNCVVVKDVEPYSVVAGVPGKVINKIDKEGFEKKYKHYRLSGYLEEPTK